MAAIVEQGVENHVVDDQLEDLDVVHRDSTRWLVIVVGCVAIWPVTVPAPRHNHKHWVVAALALPNRGSFGSSQSGPKRGRGRGMISSIWGPQCHV